MFISADNFFIKKWWALFLFIDLILISFTIADYHTPVFAQKWRLISPFVLSEENNIAVWWSGMTILLAAILCFDRYRSHNTADKNGWLILSIVMAGLSLDEIGSLHERVGLIAGWNGILPFGIILFCLVSYAIFKIYSVESTKKCAILILIGFAIYGSVALQEQIEHATSWPQWSIGLRAGIEEGSELLGSFLIIMATLIQREKNTAITLSSLLPQLKTFFNLKSIVTISLILHIIGSYIFLELDNPHHRGNPMNWYPVSIYFLTALLCILNALSSHTLSRSKWFILTAAFMISSIGIMTNLFVILLPGIGNILSRELAQEKFVIFYLFQIIIFGLTIFKLPNINISSLLLSLIFITGLVTFSVWTNNIWLRYSILGSFSYVVFIYISLITKRNYNDLM